MEKQFKLEGNVFENPSLLERTNAFPWVVNNLDIDPIRNYECWVYFCDLSTVLIALIALSAYKKKLKRRFINCSTI